MLSTEAFTDHARWPVWHREVHGLCFTGYAKWPVWHGGTSWLDLCDEAVQSISLVFCKEFLIAACKFLWKKTGFLPTLEKTFSSSVPPLTASHSLSRRLHCRIFHWEAATWMGTEADSEFSWHCEKAVVLAWREAVRASSGWQITGQRKWLSEPVWNGFGNSPAPVADAERCRQLP